MTMFFLCSVGDPETWDEQTFLQIMITIRNDDLFNISVLCFNPKYLLFHRSTIKMKSTEPNSCTVKNAYKNPVFQNSLNRSYINGKFGIPCEYHFTATLLI